MNGSTDRTVASPDLLFALGAGTLTQDAIALLAHAVYRRRVGVLEAIRREPQASEGGVVALIRAWFEVIASGSNGESLLRDPFVGIWAEAVLRGERSIDEAGAIARLVGPQLDVERALEFEVPTPGGVLHLPRFGGTIHFLGAETANLRLAQRQIDVESRQGRASISPTFVAASGGLAWTPTRQMELNLRGSTFRVELGSDDPAAVAVGPSAPQLLDDGGHARWGAVLEKAWEHIVAHHHGSAAAVAAAASIILLQAEPDHDRHVSSSNSDGFGVVGLSFTEDTPTLAVGLIHEARHALLSAALTMVDLHDDDATPRFYAGWRDDPRPLGALLQGACAFAAVTAFWRVEHQLTDGVGTRRRAALEATRWWSFTSDALSQLRSSGQLSSLGSRFVDGLDQLVGSEPTVEPIVAAAAADLMAEHHMKWFAGRRAWQEHDHPEFGGTTLTEAWNARLFSAHSQTDVDPVDRALTLDDPIAAVELAGGALLAQPDSPAAAFRFARALLRVGRTDVAIHIDNLVESGNLAPIAAALGGLGTAHDLGWSNVADLIASALRSEDRQSGLASAAREQC